MDYLIYVPIIVIYLALIVPVAHYYNEADEEDYIKYSCPICDVLEVKHQVSKGEPNCFLCGVNLDWKNIEGLKRT